MTEDNKFLWSILRKRRREKILIVIDTVVVDPQNEFSGDRAPTAPDDSAVQVPVNHDFSDIFERDKFDCIFVVRGELYYIS